MVELRGIDIVVFDGVAGPDHLGIFQARNRGDHLGLHVDGHAGGHAVHVDFVGVESLGLKEYLVLQPVGELHHLVFNRRTVARPNAGDLAAIERRAMHVLAQDAVRLGVGVGDVADHLRLGNFLRSKREGGRHRIARLRLELAPVDGPSIQAWRSAGLHPAVPQS